jgi:hypothetical protein
MRYALKHSSTLIVFCIEIYSLPLADGSRTFAIQSQGRRFPFHPKHYLPVWDGIFGTTQIKLLYWSLKHYREITGYVTKHLAASLGAL